MTRERARRESDTEERRSGHAGESAARRRYAAPNLTDLGDVRRLTLAGGPASTDDAFGTGMNMQKFTMIG